MKKRKVLIVVIAVLLLYAVFAIVVTTLFHSIQNDPIDVIAIPYLRYDTNIEEEYGEIKHIGKNLLYETKKSDNRIESPYGLETENGHIIAYVTLVKEENEWVPISYDIVEVRTNDD